LPGGRLVPYAARTLAEQEALSFADRLPPVVPREEADISHLSDEMADVLYPGRRPRPFRMGVLFEEPAGALRDEVLALARAADHYAEEPPSPTGARMHRAEFGPAGAARLRTLFARVGELPSTEVVVDGKRVPYARELWLPLFWILI
jgi:hypothetical protein